jgi:hypothetical protein
MRVATLDYMTQRFTYILPLRSARSLAGSDLTPYLCWLAPRAEVIVVDGSVPAIFAEHAAAWGAMVRHIPPADHLMTPMGKVGNVLTGVYLATHENLVIADDDVRYDAAPLDDVVNALSSADVVRPQNYFTDLPWHAWWDTGRTLLNRVTGGDWPGTLGVRRSFLLRTGGYRGDVMFENLELIRTVIAAGGREQQLPGTFVARRPSTTPHFWSQRVRQAYDEFARPFRLVLQLAIIPVLALLMWQYGPVALLAFIVVVIVAAEAGRRRAGGTTVFPMLATLMAPLWVAERAICSWLALGSRIAFGGIRYRDVVLPHAATPLRTLRRQFASASPVAPADTAPRRSA